MEATIQLKDVIATMDSGAEFSIGFRTYDKRKEKGGEWIAFDCCVKHNYLTAEQRETANRAKQNRALLKDPKHYENSTRNIRVINNGNIVKVHLRLIRRFNGKTVL
jgi:hypothetical protein